MRLLLLTDDYLPHWGGSRVYYHELLSRMARRGDCVCVATRRRAGSSEFDAAQPYQARPASPKQTRVLTCPGRALPTEYRTSI
jgi:glycosyltransferase involved in cell wall biosynthesis